MPRYEFKLTLSGDGKTEMEAAMDAVDAFCADPGVLEGTIEHDPETCGCEYRGNDMWSCGYIDNMNMVVAADL